MKNLRLVLATCLGSLAILTTTSTSYAWVRGSGSILNRSFGSELWGGTLTRDNLQRKKAPSKVTQTFRPSRTANFYQFVGVQHLLGTQFQQSSEQKLQGRRSEQAHSTREKQSLKPSDDRRQFSHKYKRETPEPGQSPTLHFTEIEPWELSETVREQIRMQGPPKDDHVSLIGILDLSRWKWVETYYDNGRVSGVWKQLDVNDPLESLPVGEKFIDPLNHDERVVLEDNVEQATHLLARALEEMILHSRSFVLSHEFSTNPKKSSKDSDQEFRRRVRPDSIPGFKEAIHQSCRNFILKNRYHQFSRVSTAIEILRTLNSALGDSTSAQETWQAAEKMPEVIELQHDFDLLYAQTLNTAEQMVAKKHFKKGDKKHHRTDRKLFLTEELLDETNPAAQESQDDQIGSNLSEDGDDSEEFVNRELSEEILRLLERKPHDPLRAQRLIDLEEERRSYLLQEDSRYPDFSPGAEEQLIHVRGVGRFLIRDELNSAGERVKVTHRVKLGRRGKITFLRDRKFN